MRPVGKRTIRSQIKNDWVIREHIETKLANPLKGRGAQGDTILDAARLAVMKVLVQNEAAPRRGGVHPGRMALVALACSVLGLGPGFTSWGLDLPVSLWPSNAVPAVLSVSDTGEVEL